MSCLTSKPLDDLLKIVGEFGKYQKIKLCTVRLVSVLCAFHAQNMVFVGARSAQYCTIPSVNLSGDSWKNVTQEDFNMFLRDVPENVGCSIRSLTETRRLVVSGQYSFEKLKETKNITIATEPCTTWTYSKEVYGSTIVSEFDLVCDRKWLTSTSKTLYFFGRLLGAIIFGQLADIFGRRIMFFAGLLMLLIVGCVSSAAPNIYVFLPESIRWLLSKGRNEEAEKIMKKLIATNKREITEEMTNTLLNKEIKPHENMENKTQERKYTALDLVRPLQMAILSLNVWFNWLVNSFVYYGLGLGTEYLGGNPYINFCIAGAVQIPADILCLLLLNKLGRRLPLCVTMVTGDMLALKITLAMIGKFMNAASYGIIYLCAAEVFPTVVRQCLRGRHT
ncbi:hypothetical protein KUTeg_014478 [Tegillarca granosa]|uniref:Uncharacterized protein n=1 Tax=Tegillarca granosa TaxID=220873 RepID=A0ABQ9ES27_TEGGR|nr:hypothetical protein KUTeg_014478 [Tegillarca granosa]